MIIFVADFDFSKSFGLRLYPLAFCATLRIHPVQEEQGGNAYEARGVLGAVFAAVT